MLTEKTIKKWVKDNNRFIGFNQYYWANGETFKTAFIYHYYNKNLDREIKKSGFCNVYADCKRERRQNAKRKNNI